MDKTLSPGAIGIRGLSLRDSIEMARMAGFDSVVFDVKEAAGLGADAAGELFAKNDVRPGYWGLPVNWRQDDQRDAGLAQLGELAAFARALGCPLVTTGVMPGSNDLAYQENFTWHVERLRPVAQVLRDNGCRLGIEFIGPKTFRAPFTHEFIYSMGGMVELAKALGTGNVGLLLDAWHLYTSGEDVSDLDSITANDVVAVHVNDAPPGIHRDEQIDSVRALPLETGVLDLVGFMGKLQRMGYAGPVMPEPFSQRLDDLAATDPAAAARETARSMDALWRAAGLA